MPKFTIRHVTRYIYDAPVRDSANKILLFPVRDEYQELLKQELLITGDPEVDTFKDYYGNEIGSFMNAEPHIELVIDSKVQVITKSRPMPDDLHPRDKQWAQLESLRLIVPYIDFLTNEQFTGIDELKSIGMSNDYSAMTPLQAAAELNEWVFREFKYIKGITSVETTLDEVWKLRAGVCQDFAHILLVMLRILGIPARYVSGYICPNKNGMRGEGATHAWVEAYIPFYGWLGLDPTNNCFVNNLHVRLAVGRHFADCSPVKGAYKGIAEHSLEVGVSVHYEDGSSREEVTAVLKPQPAKNGGQQNSYQRYIEMMQQQQQQ
jgi:transglutaminase-like putative cysteine protease